MAKRGSLRWVGLLSASLLVAFPTRASAADPDVDQDSCKSAFEDSERILKGSKQSSVDLFAAREKLRVCSRPVCSSWMIADCTKSLVDVGDRIPSVIVTATDERGQNANDVKVLVDGQVLFEQSDGRQHEVNPGAHKLTCVYKSGPRVDVQTIAVERVHGAAIRCEQPLLAKVAETTNVPKPNPVTLPPAEPASSASPLRWIGLGAVGVGVVGLALGTVFGLKASGSKSDANCDANNRCDPGPLADARSSATVSTVSFVVGGVFAAGGIALFALAPKAETKVGTLSPWATPNAGGVSLSRRF